MISPGISRLGWSCGDRPIVLSHVGGAHDDIRRDGAALANDSGGMEDTSRRRRDRRHEEDND